MIMRWFVLPCLALLLSACGDDQAPRILTVDFPVDTTDTEGPYVVTAVVTDNLGVHAVYLLMTTDPEGAYARERMPEVSEGHYEHALPGLPPESTLFLVVEAVDVDGNRSNFPDCEQFGDLCWYSFSVSSGPD
jgi:hypothetical protein